MGTDVLISYEVAVLHGTLYVLLRVPVPLGRSTLSFTEIASHAQ